MENEKDAKINVEDEYKTVFTIPGNLADDMTAVIAYQNTQLIYLICKEKKWDPKELMKHFY